MERTELNEWLTEIHSIISPITEEIDRLESGIENYKKRVDFLDGLPPISKDQVLRNEYVNKGNEWEKRLDMLLQERTRFAKVGDEINRALYTIT